MITRAKNLKRSIPSLELFPVEGGLTSLSGLVNALLTDQRGNPLEKELSLYSW